MKPRLHLPIVLAVILALTLLLIDPRTGYTDIDKALRNAASRGDTERIRQLIAEGANVNASDNNGWTVLMIRAQRCDAKMVRVLLSAGADPNGGKIPALLLAARCDSAGTVKALLAGGADTEVRWAKSGATPLIDAADMGRIEPLKALLAGGANVNAKDSIGRTALMKASWSGHTEIVKALLEAGAEVNTKNKYGQTCLDSAAVKGHTDIVKTLLAAGADVDFKTWKHVNRYGKEEIAQLLFEAHSNQGIVERLKDIEIHPFGIVALYFHLWFAITIVLIASYKNRSPWRWLCIGLLTGPLGFMVILFPRIPKPGEKPLSKWEKSIEARVLGYKIGLSFVLPLGALLLCAHFTVTLRGPDETNMFGYGGVAMILIPLAFFKWELSKHRRIRERRTGELTDKTYKKGESIEP